MNTPRTDKAREHVQDLVKEAMAMESELEASRRECAVMREALESNRDTAIAMKDAVREGNKGSVLFCEAPERIRQRSVNALSGVPTKDFVRREVLEKCVNVLATALEDHYQCELSVDLRVKAVKVLKAATDELA